jgi:hypothetical protein
MDSFEAGEPVSLVYLRFDHDTTSFYGLDLAVQHRVPAVALVYEPIYVESSTKAANYLKHATLIHVYEEFAGLPYPGDHLPYPPYANKDRKVPTTGFFGVHHILNNYQAASVHLFGFTWQGWRWHEWDHEKRVIQRYANEGRVTVHSV